MRPEIWDELIERYRGMTAGEKITISGEISRMDRRLAFTDIRERNPEATDHELVLKLIEHMYGLDLADKMRQYCAREGKHLRVPFSPHPDER
jgi:hypothetical protein